MVKVLFFYIDTQTSSGYTTGLGIASISGYLKKHEVSTDLVYYKTDKDLQYSMKKIGDFLPDIIGFYSTSSNWRTVQALSRKIRERFPEIFQIYGGIHAILVPETLNAITSLDALCAGFGEAPLLDLAERIAGGKEVLNTPGLWVRQRKSGRDEVVKNPPYFPEDRHDELLNFDYEIFLRELSRFQDFNREAYRLEIIFVRGCPFKCSFCCNNRLSEIYNKRLFTPSPEASIRALKDSLQTTNLKLVEIHDDTFTLNKRWFREFIERYASTVKVPFICNLRAGTFDEQQVRLLKKAGIHTAWVGIESGNDYIRKDVMKKPISKEEILKAFNLLHSYDIHTITQNIIGVPYETPRHFMDTIRINAEIQPDRHLLSVFYPYPKTQLHELCVREGWIDSGADSFVERVEPVLNLPDFSKGEVGFYVRNFERLVRYQHRRIKRPYLYILPLTYRTSWVIAGMMSVSQGISSIINKMVKSIISAKLKDRLRSWQQCLRDYLPAGRV